MAQIPLTIQPERWLAQIFSARAVAEGGIVRRKSRDIERIVGRDLFLAELDRRGFRAVENSGQTIIFCNRAPLQIVRG
jgi:hypothetical protein